MHRDPDERLLARLGLHAGDAGGLRAGPDHPHRLRRGGARLQLREGVGSSVEGTEATWAYNANGQVAAVIDGNGNRAELRYDGHGRQDRGSASIAPPAAHPRLRAEAAAVPRHRAFEPSSAARTPPAIFLLSTPHDHILAAWLGDGVRIWGQWSTRRRRTGRLERSEFRHA